MEASKFRTDSDEEPFENGLGAQPQNLLIILCVGILNHTRLDEQASSPGISVQEIPYETHYEEKM